jgi:hypothetical protein
MHVELKLLQPLQKKQQLLSKHHLRLLWTTEIWFRKPATKLWRLGTKHTTLHTPLLYSTV